MKIVEAVNSMIGNPNLLGSVTLVKDEYFFTYKKYNWSIKNTGGDYVLFLYPAKDVTIDELIGRNDFEWVEHNDYVAYNTKDLKTREAIESFTELFQMVSSKVLGIDDILDDIIKDNDW